MSARPRRDRPAVRGERDERPATVGTWPAVGREGAPMRDATALQRPAPVWAGLSGALVVQEDFGSPRRRPSTGLGQALPRRACRPGRKDGVTSTRAWCSAIPRRCAPSAPTSRAGWNNGPFRSSGASRPTVPAVGLNLSEARFQGTPAGPQPQRHGVTQRATRPSVRDSGRATQQSAARVREGGRQGRSPREAHPAALNAVGSKVIFNPRLLCRLHGGDLAP